MKSPAHHHSETPQPSPTSLICPHKRGTNTNKCTLKIWSPGSLFGSVNNVAPHQLELPSPSPGMKWYEYSPLFRTGGHSFVANGPVAGLQGAASMLPRQVFLLVSDARRGTLRPGFWIAGSKTGPDEGRSGGWSRCGRARRGEERSIRKVRVHVAVEIVRRER